MIKMNVRNHMWTNTVYSMKWCLRDSPKCKNKLKSCLLHMVICYFKLNRIVFWFSKWSLFFKCQANITPTCFQLATAAAAVGLSQTVWMCWLWKSLLCIIVFAFLYIGNASLKDSVYIIQIFIGSTLQSKSNRILFLLIKHWLLHVPLLGY